jgi:SAM-dependent methyltransferase
MSVAAGFRCPLCGSARASTELLLRDVLNETTDASFPLVRCDTCGLRRLHPPPDDATLAAAYNADYAPHQRLGLSGWFKSGRERRSVRRLHRFLAAPSAVLDVGCATGELLLAIRAAGNPSVRGVEPGARAARIAQQRGLDVFIGTLEDAAPGVGSVDTIIMSHTLEHLRDPLATLRDAARILRPGGALLLWLPNVESLEARLLRQRWIGYDAPRHLTSFGVTTLTRALDGAGFCVVDVRHEAIGLEWAWAARLWTRERWPRLERLLGALHPLLIILGTPLAVVGALQRRSGRIRVIALRDRS